ncbi:MAG: succinylglutamate desuccinylase/aspartoacylase family protein [Bdellovibrionales bacterium]|nr:succinylglutamate desuccinylase/aspartoacylase family protein [Bdellovibrionales bacterium]
MEYLEKFKEFEKQYSGPIDYSLRFPSTEANYPHIYFSACVHGNEIGSLPALFELIENLHSKKINYPGTITISLGNIEAIKQDVRFVEKDMNRHFGDSQTHHPEAQRANKLCQLIDECDLFIDLHQTIEPTSEPFFVLSDVSENRNFAQALALINKAILRSPTNDSYLTATTYAYRKNKIAVTIELSQKGINTQATQLAKKIFTKTFDLACAISTGKKIEDLCKGCAPLTWLAITHYQEFDGPLCHLTEGFSNLDFVSKGQVLGYKNNGEAFTAPFDGFVLFPKYVERDEKGASIQTPPKDIIALTKIIS